MFLELLKGLLTGNTLHKGHILPGKICQRLYEFQIASDKTTVEVKESIKGSYIVQVAENFLLTHSLHLTRVNADSIRTNN